MPTLEPIDPKDWDPETKRFMAWYKDQTENHGLLDWKPFIKTPVPPGTTVEDVFREVMRMIEAPSVPDPDFF